MESFTVISDRKSSWPPGQRGSDWQEDGSDFMPHIPVLNEAVGGGGRGEGTICPVWTDNHTFLSGCRNPELGRE
jgi:hypothetical protein